jgi:iron(III) transport system ATP-binding protein
MNDTAAASLPRADAPATPPLLSLQAASVAYGRQTVVADLSLDLARGEIGCLLGASGCGKTTVLRAIAGFEPLRTGRMLLDGREIATAGDGLPPEARRVGMMFQDYALFPHLDAAANVAFGLHALAKPARLARARELLDLVGLADRAGAYPHELSGGQQQRVALARALAPEPLLVLLDEPFSNLDVDIRGRLAGDTRRLLRAAGTTALLVAHDQAEAFAMADRIGLMAEGRILQWDAPEALYARPADRRVAGFVGRGDWLRSETLGLGEGGDLRLRPGQLVVDAEGPLSALLESVTFRGPEHLGRLRFDSGERVEIALSAAEATRVGERLRLRVTGEPLRFARDGAAGEAGRPARS